MFAPGNKKMIEVWKMFNDEVKALEVELVKLETIYSFINSEGIHQIIQYDSLKEVHSIRDEILIHFDGIVTETDRLTNEATFEDFRYLWDYSKAIQGKKNSILAILSPYFGKIFEEKMFQNLTGKSEPAIRTEKYESETADVIHNLVDDDFTIIFDSLFDKEIEFYTIFAEPKPKLKQYLDSIVNEESGSPVKKKDPLYASLTFSRLVYQSQMEKSRKEIADLYKRVQYCTQMLQSLANENPELEPDITNFLSDLSTQQVKNKVAPLRSNLVKKKDNEMEYHRLQTEIGPSKETIKISQSKESSIRNTVSGKVIKTETNSNYEVLTKLMSDHMDDGLLQIDSGYVLKLDGHDSRATELVAKLSKLQLPSIKGIQLSQFTAPRSLVQFSELNSLFSKSVINNLENLYLNLGEWVDLKHFGDGLKVLFSKVTGQIYLDKFKINDKELKMLFESGHEVPSIVLRSCQVNITTSFSLKLSLNYLTEELNLFGTCDLKDADFITSRKLEILVATLSTTSMRTNLENAIV